MLKTKRTIQYLGKKKSLVWLVKSKLYIFHLLRKMPLDYRTKEGFHRVPTET